MSLTFQGFSLREPILKAIDDLGFKSPTPIQEKTIPLLLEEVRDIIALAQTGTGKTAAFGLPIVQLTDFDSHHPQALIIAPTRELCMQITNDIKNFCKYIREANIVPVYGGASIENQIKDLKRGAQIIVSTPGRMVDIISRKKIDLSKVKIVVLDEADEMLNMGFKEDLDAILEQTPEQKNVLLFSATMPNEVARIAKNYMVDPIEVSTGKKNQSAENIDHVFYRVHSRDKYLALQRIIDYNPDIFGIIFCRTKSETQDVADKLTASGYNADALHGDLSQYQRDMVMKKFRRKQLQLLVATDVAARGIDVDNITHVINYNLPDDSENYTHRSGRTARAGKHGTSIVLVGGRESSRIREVERIIKKSFTEGKVPTTKNIMEKRSEHFVNDFKTFEVPEIKLSEKAHSELMHLTKEELITRLVGWSFKDLVKTYENSKDLASDDSDRRRDGQSNKPFDRLFINVGKTDGLGVGELINFVCTTLDCTKASMGRIDLKATFSFFEIENQFTAAALKELQKRELLGRKVRIEITEGSGSSSSHGNKSRGSSFEKGGRSSGGRSSGGRSEGGYGREKSYGGGRSEGGFSREKSYGGAGRSEKSPFFGGKKEKSSSSFGERKERGSSFGGGSSEGREKRPRKRSF